jgi:hypothetical protein
VQDQIEKIKVTPEMIEAGVAALIKNLGGDNVGECTIAYSEAVEDVFIAMLQMASEMA